MKIEIKTYQGEIMDKLSIRPGLKVVTAFVVAQAICLPAAAQVSKEVLDSITTPDQVKTSIGTLKFLDGAPYPETADTVYDYLDTMRGVNAFLKGMPGASLHGLIKGAHDVGAVNTTRSWYSTSSWTPGRCS